MSELCARSSAVALRPAPENPEADEIREQIPKTRVQMGDTVEAPGATVGFLVGMLRVRLGEDSRKLE